MVLVCFLNCVFPGGLERRRNKEKATRKFLENERKVKRAVSYSKALWVWTVQSWLSVREAGPGSASEGRVGEGAGPALFHCLLNTVN